MAGEWIVRLADEERKRDEVRFRVTEAAARKAQLVAENGQRLVDELQTAVIRDIAAFRGQFSADAARNIAFEAAESVGGFVVRKPEYPTVVLKVVPHLPAASVSCEYRFTPSSGLPAREDRVEFMFTSEALDGTLQIKHLSTGQVFTSAEALSEFLLVPVFTGRPR